MYTQCPYIYIYIYMSISHIYLIIYCILYLIIYCISRSIDNTPVRFSSILWCKSSRRFNSSRQFVISSTIQFMSPIQFIPRRHASRVSLRTHIELNRRINLNHHIINETINQHIILYVYIYIYVSYTFVYTNSIRNRLYLCPQTRLARGILTALLEYSILLWGQNLCAGTGLCGSGAPVVSSGFPRPLVSIRVIPRLPWPPLVSRRL